MSSSSASLRSARRSRRPLRSSPPPPWTCAAASAPGPYLNPSQWSRQFPGSSSASELSNQRGGGLRTVQQLAHVRLAAAQRVDGRNGAAAATPGRAGRRSRSPTKRRRRRRGTWRGSDPEVGPGVLRRLVHRLVDLGVVEQALDPAGGGEAVVRPFSGRMSEYWTSISSSLASPHSDPSRCRYCSSSWSLATQSSSRAHSIGSRSSRSRTDSQRASTSTVWASASAP